MKISSAHRIVPHLKLCEISRISRFGAIFSMESSIAFVTRGVRNDNCLTGRSEFAMFSTSSSLNIPCNRSIFFHFSVSLFARQMFRYSCGNGQNISMLLDCMSSNMFNGRRISLITISTDKTFNQ